MQQQEVSKSVAWKAYRVSFRLLAPMHVGWRKLGNLQQTRPYLTGRNLWGAFTARLTREKGSDNYKAVGEEVDNQLAFTYFYPSTREDTISLWPWADEDKFAWTFLGSYASTALENGHSAEAGSLHETEYIAPYTRQDQNKCLGEQVFLVGYIFEQGGYADWKSVLDQLQFGGERSYGWGRVKGKQTEITDQRCFDYTFVDDEALPRLVASDEGMNLLAHTLADSEERGVAIEPLVGRETTQGNTNFGRSVSKAEICWVPGGSVKQNESFQIQKRGLWKPYSKVE